MERLGMDSICLNVPVPVQQIHVPGCDEEMSRTIIQFNSESPMDTVPPNQHLQSPLDTLHTLPGIIMEVDGNRIMGQSSKFFSAVVPSTVPTVARSRV